MTRRVLLVPAIAVCMSTLLFTSASIAKGPGNKPGGERVVSVYTDVVAEHQVSQTISLIGKLQSDKSVNIATEVSGKVKTIQVSANQEVKEGQLLFQLDDAKAQAALKEAKAYLADEQRKLKEYSKLVKKNAVTKTAMDGQAAIVDIATARLASAKTDVKHHNLTAPFSGTIGLIDFSRGKMVSTGVELMTLDDLSVMKLDLQIPERYLSLLSSGMKVTAVSQAWQNQQFEGEVVAIDSRINQETLNLRVRVEFANEKNQLKPGMMMSATMAFPAISEAIIPVQALEYSGTKRFVYVINDKGIAKRTEVILGARIDDQVLIEKGVALGDKIVVQGLVNMRDGMKVKDLAQAATPAKESH